ncbi:MAG: hypothetical protein A3D44_02470 [Candidatus Staskawiczbacteria bacterium RIFCSPHIGHO2_02_FULL_42_22]|uniref:Uncharacterized protein n=1 Tax=Candidatus Staskawiczbacteria bacterium RIFCSPHIGHO2_02_FULL_42_22 TaxID=1802207 RepID=A0A1G2I1E5_9BACT|nr:MAG: hypothetical protein A3D44_02470 [Candidatus Staskawiczbacteria bacterium RIFCSPHIGHO2_02_FULL_42_22]
MTGEKSNNVEREAADWQNEKNPYQMLWNMYENFSKYQNGRAALELVRRVYDLLPEEGREAFKIFEQYFYEKGNTKKEGNEKFEEALNRSIQAWQAIRLNNLDGFNPSIHASRALTRLDLFGDDHVYDQINFSNSMLDLIDGAGDARSHLNPQLIGQERELQSDIIHDVLKNPFENVFIDSEWLAFNDGMVPKIAQAIYDAGKFDEMPILADALEDAGCTNEEILNHCRKTGPHVRGCWVLDLILEK